MSAYPLAVRLPLNFPPAPLLEEANHFDHSQWLAHFNSSNYSGDWSGVVFRGPAGAYGLLPVGASPDTPSTNHPTLNHCPAVFEVLSSFQCPILSARFLRLGPGSIICEHSDYDLEYNSGIVRIHIPVATNDDVEFIVANQRILMIPGECWFLDLFQPHRVQNFSDSDRVHLVLDCRSNPWLLSLIENAAPSAENQSRLSPAAPALAHFRDFLFNNSDWLLQAQALPRDETFSTALVTLAAQAGFRFSVEDVRCNLRENRRRAIRHQMV